MTASREVALSEQQCHRLLESNHFGRVAVIDPQGPLILPVNYAVADGTVVFRTDAGTKLEAAEHQGPASFQIDDVDLHRELGWSVLVRGRAAVITDEDELARLRELPLEPFAGGEKPHYVRIVADEITGRRIPLPRTTPQDWFRRPDLGNIWFGQDGTDLLG